jgi:hypothetical protein
MPNLYKGEVEISLKKSIAKKLLQPKDHKTVFLRYNMESIGDMEVVFKSKFGSDTSIFEILERNREHPIKVSVFETITMLEYGLKSQFGAMNYSLAASILDNENIQDVLDKVTDALNIAFKGTVPMEEEDEKSVKDDLPSVDTAVEGDGKSKK